MAFTVAELTMGDGGWTLNRIEANPDTGSPAEWVLDVRLQIIPWQKSAARLERIEGADRVLLDALGYRQHWNTQVLYPVGEDGGGPTQMQVQTDMGTWCATTYAALAAQWAGKSVGMTVE